jgi:hypothetical protein
MGAHPDDYAATLPPRSYISVDDFDSPRDLAEYLRLLDTHDALYNEYFRWKSEWRVFLHDAASYWCRVCGLLHVADEQRYVHWYTDYSEWWDGDGHSMCASRWMTFRGTYWRTWKSAN